MSLDYPSSAKRKRKAVVTVDLPRGPDLRREMDSELRTTWQAQFDDLSDQVDELTRTVRGFNGTPGLTQEMTRVITILQEMGPKVNALHEFVIEERARASIAKKEQEDGENKPLTLGRLAMLAFRFSQPVLTALMIWLLLTFFPNLFRMGIP